MKELNEKLADRENENFALYPIFPKKNLLLELSNMCNHKCIFCANRKMTRKKGVMSKNIIDKALSEAYELGCREVGFYSTGEPLINNNVFYAIKLAKQIGFTYTYLTTNGSLCNLETAEKLINAGIDSIKFSINALDEKTYNFIHGVNSFNLVMQNVKNLYNLRKKLNKNFKIFVSYIATEFSNAPAESIKKFFSTFCDDVLVVNARNQSGLVPEVNTFLSKSEDEDKYAGKRKLPCYYAFNTITITYEGYLTACCTDYQNYLVYGNLNKSSLKECWNNKIITELRKQHLSQKLKNNLCNNCIFQTKKCPKPLIKEYATIFDAKTMFKSDEVENRIKNFKESYDN